MAGSGSQWVHDQNTHSVSSGQPHVRRKNVARLLVRREIAPTSKYLPRNKWSEGNTNLHADYYVKPTVETVIDARRQLLSWVEEASFQHFSAKYCSLCPATKSTIALAFSPDGKILASTHGDHTIKLIDCQSGSCLQELRGHRRTPWVVRFHPSHPEILASGSLDGEVCLWNSNTSKCIGSCDYANPISSIVFHAERELLAVATGCKLYLWKYNKGGGFSARYLFFKAKRALRAVHFHPHAAPLILTAAANTLDSSDSSMTLATSLNSLHYPPPSVFMLDERPNERRSVASELPLMSSPSSYVPSIAGNDSRTYVHVGNVITDSIIEDKSYGGILYQIDLNATGQYDHRVSTVDMSAGICSDAQPVVEEDDLPNYYPSGITQRAVHDAMIDDQTPQDYHPGISFHADASATDTSTISFLPRSSGGSILIHPNMALSEFRQNQFLSSWDPAYWELPFMQEWLMGQRQAVVASILAHTGGRQDYSSGYVGVHHLPSYSVYHADHGQGVHFSNPNNMDGRYPVPMISGIQSDLTAAMTATAATKVPRTANLTIWYHDLKYSCASSSAQRCLLNLPYAVLCSEMGTHFSPCGRFLAACVACVLPGTEADPELLTQFHHSAAGAATSPTQHPVSARQVTYELHIYSLEKPNFGLLLVSRTIRAAQFLTSIQFSPTSEHLMLTYGCHDSSLLKSIVIDGETSLHICTVLEVYRVSNLELVRELASTEDEVNVACFHPLAGGGIAYGTKEGKVRILRYD